MQTDIHAHVYVLFALLPDVKFLVWFVRNKRLDNEVGELAFGTSNLQFLVHLVRQPFSRSIEVNVDLDES